MKLEDRRAAAKAATPWRDQVADRFKWFMVKLGFWAAVIIIICLVSVNSAKGH